MSTNMVGKSNAKIINLYPNKEYLHRRKVKHKRINFLRRIKRSILRMLIHVGIISIIQETYEVE